MRTYRGKTMPKLRGTQAGVVLCEKATGLVLTTALVPKVGGKDDEWLLIFESVDEAQAYAAVVVRDRPDLECWIYRAGHRGAERVVGRRK